MDFTNDYGQNNLFILKSILKIIIRALKPIQKNFDCFTSKPNAHETFSNLHIKNNLKISISRTNRPIEMQFFCALYFQNLRIYSRPTKIIKFWPLIWQLQNSTKFSPSVP